MQTSFCLTHVGSEQKPGLNVFKTTWSEHHFSRFCLSTRGNLNNAFVSAYFSVSLNVRNDAITPYSSTGRRFITTTLIHFIVSDIRIISLISKPNASAYTSVEKISFSIIKMSKFDAFSGSTRTIVRSRAFWCNWREV